MRLNVLRISIVSSVLVAVVFGILLVNFSSAQTASSSQALTSTFLAPPTTSTPPARSSSSPLQIKTKQVAGMATSTPIDLSSETFTGRSTYLCSGDVRVVSCVATSGLVTYESSNILGKTLKFDAYNHANADTSFGASICGGTCTNANTGKSVILPNCSAVPSGSFCGQWQLNH
jgi:hypothetical protein